MLTLPGYTLSQLIYEGVNAAVYRGRRDRDQGPVVIKSHKPDRSAPKEVARYRREFEIGRQFDHPGIIRYYEAQEHSHGLALILEDFGGEGLNTWIPPTGMSAAVFLNIAIQLAKALEAIHTSQIIHKDIKPQSVVFNSQTNHAKIISFGLASQLRHESQPAVRSLVLEGTLAYLSPEQTGRMNRAVDYRTDFYSLGATFYEMLTGERPFQSWDGLELIHAHLARTPVPPHQQREHIPLTLSRIVLKLMAKTPEERYQSASGLRADLEACWEQWRTVGAIRDFTLAQNDVPASFQIPQKLYGREAESVQLLAAFERVRRGATELVFVGGPSGIGKSALIHELQPPLTHTRGHFVYGKFDRLHRNVPYFALIQAFEELVHQWLAESAALAVWREKLLAALGPNGQIILDVIPAVELIIGPQPPVQILPPGEAQNRFNLVFQDFIRALAQPEHPLILVLDDLQWADSGSLQILRLALTDPGIRRLLLVGAYRDNEVDSTHPLSLVMETLRQAGATLTSLKLTPLSLDSLRPLIAETLHCNAQRAQPLAELALSRTQGNPFFVNEFLHSLYAEGHLQFRKGEWHWDKVQALDFSPNVADLITARLRQLSPVTQEALAAAACLGHSFDLDTLAGVREKSPATALADLQEALEVGLIVPLDDNYKFLPYAANLSGQVGFKFLHDRVRQAADQLLDEARSTAIHLQAGQYLLHTASAESLNELIFVIADHLNLGQSLLPEVADPRQGTDRLELARLNLRAGQKALASTAYLPASNYLNAGMQLLPEASWQTHPELTRDLYRASAEAEYLQAHFARAETLFADLERHAGSSLEQALIATHKVMLYTHVFRLPEAITIGLAGLQCLGHSISTEPEALQALFPIELQKISAGLAGHSILELENLPRLTDPTQAAALNLMISLSVPAFYTRQDLYGLLTLKMVNLSLEAGNDPASAVAYNYYGFMLGTMLGDYQSGYEFGQLALRLSQQFNDLSAQGIIHFGFSVFINHWRQPARTNQELLRQAYRFNLEAGNLLFANFTLTAMIAQMVSRGDALDSILLELSPCLDFARRSPHKDLFSIVALARQWVLSLKGTLPPGQFEDQNFSETAFLEQNHRIGNLVMVHWFYLLKAQVFYLYGQPSEALKMIQLSDPFVMASTGQLHLAEYYFYYALSLTALYSSASPDDQTRYLELAQSCQARMKTWADNCEANFWHKYLLISAELARVAGQDLEAMALYEQALQSAREHTYPQNEALANELAGQFYLARGFQSIARAYLAEARYTYNNWGASGRVRQLEEQYPQWFKPVSRTGADTTLTLTTVALDRFGIGVFDVLTILKAAQAISSEIVLDQLLAALMKIVMENAGAQTGYLLLAQNDTWAIAAKATAEAGAVSCLPYQPPAEARLPVTLIHYVARTQENIVISDVQQESQFAQDPDLIARQTRSVLCAPLLFKSAVTGILYLENNLTPGAFPPDRLELLKLIASQAAISLETACLYTDLKQEVVERQRAEQIAQANEQRFYNLFENAPLYICEVDLTQEPVVVLQANRHFRALYGWPMQPVTLSSPDQLIPRESIPGLTQMIKRVQAGETVSAESTIRPADGSLLPVRLIISPSPIGDGRIIVVAEDITVEKQRRSEIEAIREDRHRIAQEIHDGLAQDLLGLRMRTNLWQNLIKTDPAQLHRELDEMHEKLSESLKEVRRSIAALRPVQLDEVGFFPAVRQIVAEFREQHRLKIKFEINGPEARLPISLEHTLFRFIQEGLNNIVKHAQASRVWINLDLEAPDQMILTLRDDGVGFDLAQLESFGRTGHLGLRQMRERIEQIGGTLSLSSRLSEGVALQVTLPLIQR